MVRVSKIMYTHGSDPTVSVMIQYCLQLSLHTAELLNSWTDNYKKLCSVGKLDCLMVVSLSSSSGDIFI